MSRNNRRRGFQSRLARLSPALDHTASRSAPDYDYADDDTTPDFRGGFSVSGYSPVRPLIRTVLPEPVPGFRSSPPKRTRSPTLSVRATFRSSDRQIKSPFKIATAITPQLADRAIECARRGIRREVIFATKTTGKGAKAPRRKRSKVKC